MTRCAAYTDVTTSLSKSISILHASIWENERRARLASDRQAAAYWAGITRTGYHGTGSFRDGK